MIRATLRRLAVLAFAIAPLALGGCAQTPADAPQEILAPADLSEEDDQVPITGPLLMEPRSFATVTYDGSGEMVHPDAVVVPHGWNAHRYWFAGTPYPRGNSRYENPSFFQGDEVDDWSVPPGLTNPLAMPESNGYLSDPDVVLDAPRGELRLYYRQTVRDADQIWLTTSHDGRQWAPARRVLEETRYSLISPAVSREPDDSWRMWTVDARLGGCTARASQVTLGQRRSPDGIWWGPPSPVILEIPGRVPWHWDVQYIKSKGEYWALVAAYRDGGSCSESSLYFARSADGTAWRASPTPLLGPGVLTRLNDLVYRSTFRYFSKSDVVDVWFSGAWLEGGAYHFSLATARYPLAELLARVESKPREVARGGEEPLPSPEVQAARAEFIKTFP